MAGLNNLGVILNSSGEVSALQGCVLNTCLFSHVLCACSVCAQCMRCAFLQHAPCAEGVLIARSSSLGAMHLYKCVWPIGQGPQRLTEQRQGREELTEQLNEVWFPGANCGIKTARLLPIFSTTCRSTGSVRKLVLQAPPPFGACCKRPPGRVCAFLHHPEKSGLLLV